MKKPRSTKAIDITGKKFSRLTAMYLTSERGKQGQRMWMCSCDCGNQKVIMQQSLTSGNTRTCGRCPNEYVINGDVVKINISTPTHPDTWTTIDLEDLPKVVPFVNQNGGQSKWLAHDSGWGCYAIDTNRSTKLHRIIIGAKTNKQLVDHLNGDKLDNRKSNLRIVTPAENNKNVRRKSNNSSGATGVYEERSSGLFVAAIQMQHKKLHIGRYDTVSEANIAYRAAAKALDFSERHGL